MSESWSYIQNGTTLGPVPEETLRSLLDSGRLSLQDLVWRPGMAEWAKACDVEDLRPTPLPAPAVSNAFAPPRSALTPYDSSAMDGQASIAASLEALRATKPWVRFMGVMGFISSGFLVVGAMGMAALSQFSRLPGPVGFLIPLVYLLMAGLQIPPAIYLNRYASRIRELMDSQSPEALAEALEAQKSFWRYVGIFTLVILCIYALVIIFGAGAAVLAAQHRF